MSPLRKMDRAGPIMKRRSFLDVIGCVLATIPSIARLEQPRVYRIGYLNPADSEDVGYSSFRRALTDLGYIVGRNTILVERFAEAKLERLPGMAADIVANNVDLIVAVSPSAIRAARVATATIPIVMAFSGDDPVKSGFAETLARPGGNTTGLTTVTRDLVPKWIEMLRDLIPGLRTIAVLRATGRADHTAQIGVLQDAADIHGIRLHVVEVRNADDFAAGFAAIAGTVSQAVIVLSGPDFTQNRFRLIELVTHYRLPSLYQYAEFVKIGGLVSYGPDIADLSSRAAGYVDKILRGANPAAMPIEQPRKLFLVINRKTASALGLKVSPALLLQADQVIQ